MIYRNVFLVLFSMALVSACGTKTNSSQQSPSNPDSSNRNLMNKGGR